MYDNSFIYQDLSNFTVEKIKIIELQELNIIRIQHFL